MTEKRQAHRREHIEVEVRDRVLEAHPIPWLHRNDLGNELITQYTDIFNSALKAYVDPETNVPSLESALHDKIKDPISLVIKGYTRYPDDGEPYTPEGLEEFLNRLEWGELRELIYAALDVNDLVDLKPLVDPNSPTPISNGGTSGSGTGLERIRDILSGPSTLDSSSQESQEERSSDSPTERSSDSSENKSEE